MQSWRRVRSLANRHERTGRGKRDRSRTACRPLPEHLESRENPSALVVGASPGSPPTVTVLDSSGPPMRSFLAYEGRFLGGVNVARGDVTGDGVDDIVTARASGRSDVKIFDGASYQLVRTFMAYGLAYRGGVDVTIGQFGEETASIVTSMAGGRGLVKVFDGRTLAPISQFTPYGRGTNGVHVAVGNIDNDPTTEIVTTPGPGGAPQVKGFDPQTGEQLYSFLGATAGHRRGLQVTAGDFDGNFVTDVAVAPQGARASVVSVWTRGSNGPALLDQFQVSASTNRGLTLGTVQPEGNRPDLIAVASAVAGSNGLSLFNTAGNRMGTVPSTVLGWRQLNVSSGTDEADSPPVAPQDWVHVIDYSPTYPYWSITKPTLNVTGFIDSKTIQFTYTPSNMPWTTDLFVGAHLFDLNTNYYYQNSTIASNTSNQLTITGPDEFQPSIVGHNLVIANDQLSDSDFYNSAFQGLWSTARYTDTDGSVLSDFQVMQKLGVTKESNTGINALRLYDWNPQRGFSSLTSGTSEHLAFLNTLQQAGLKVIVPVSNFFLGDNNAWSGASPDAQYDFSNGIPKAITDNFEYFLKSISADGQGGHLHPAVSGIEVGNEIDLNSGAVANGDMTALLKRTLWWVVNLQQRLQAQGDLNPSDPQRVRFTVPVSNADQSDSNTANKSWFQIFRHGAGAGDLTPSGPPAGTTFSSAVTGLEPLKGADWYSTWFYNSYQTSQTGAGLLGLLDQYNTPQGVGDWSKQWPGENFPVPLLLTELDYSIVEAGSEEAYFDTFANQQVQIAENFLRGKAQINGRTIQNQKFIGYALFEFNQEPNKGLSDAPTSEQTRGILKYYQGTDVNQWRTPSPAVANPTTPLTQLPPDANGQPQSFAPFRYPVYPFFSIKSGQTRLVDKLQSIIRAALSSM